MAAYIIFDVEVTDPTLADDYLKLANESLVPFQSKTILHGGMVEVLEGDWEPKTLVIVEFESKEQARQWYKSRIHQSKGYSAQDSVLQCNLD